MGLFGGFKAKFTRNSKEKKTKNEVVCLKYHVCSEFDQQDSSIPTIPIKTDLKKNGVIRKPSSAKPRKSVTNNHIFENKKKVPPPPPPRSQSLSTITSNDELVHTPPPKYQLTPTKSLNQLNEEPSKAVILAPSKSLNHLNVEPHSFQVSSTIEIPKGSTSLTVIDTKVDKTITESNGHLKEDFKIEANKHSYSFNKGQKNEQHKKTVVTASRNNSTEYDKSTLIFMTQNSNDSLYDIAKKEELPTNDSILPSKNKRSITFDDDTVSIQTTEDDFKINFVQHNNYYEYSEDEQSYYDEEGSADFKSMGYSSQASSIFFGGDEEPEIVRPRNFKLIEKEEKLSDSADC